MFISAIIPTMNRAKTLEDTVLSLLGQTLDKDLYEIIIMDQSTGPDTRELNDRLSGSSNLKITYFYNDIPGVHSSRNIGVKKAAGDIIVFLDDDVIADLNFLKKIYDSFIKDPEIALMTGKVLPVYESDNIPDWVESFWVTDIWGKYIWEISLLDAGDIYKEINPQLVFGCCYIIRKDIYVNYKGTYPDIFPSKFIKYSGSGETLLAIKVQRDRKKVMYNPKIKIKHVVSKERLTPEYFYYRYYIMGIQESYFDIRRTGKRLPLKQVIRDLYFFSKDIFIIVFKFYNKVNRVKFKANWNKFRGRMQHKWWVLMDGQLFDFILRDNYFDDGKEFLQE